MFLDFYTFEIGFPFKKLLTNKKNHQRNHQKPALRTYGSCYFSALENLLHCHQENGKRYVKLVFQNIMHFEIWLFSSLAWFQAWWISFFFLWASKNVNVSTTQWFYTKTPKVFIDRAVRALTLLKWTLPKFLS